MTRRAFEIHAMRIWVDHLAQLAALEFMFRDGRPWFPWRDIVNLQEFRKWTASR